MVRVGMISLGCARNLLDSEVMLGSLKKGGFEIVDIEKDPDICIINTCAFVRSAREESLDQILEVERLKKLGRIKHLVIAGCLSQLYKSDLARGLKSADLIVGTSDFPRIAELVKNLSKGRARSHVSGHLDYIYDESSPRFLLTPKHYAYVKISEGCSNSCSYCIISKLRGSFRSRPIESIVKEVISLSRAGSLREINLIGQDTTLFGSDRYGKKYLQLLLRQICALKNSVRWVRILYTHPAHYSGELIAAIKDEDKICKYLDLPIQHINDGILAMMNRRTTKKDIAGLLKKLRKNIPGLVLRTSVIVGFPTETDEVFRELLDFVRDTRFDRLGAFIYSKEDGTKASKFEGQVAEDVKQARYDELMKLQQGISQEINRSSLGRTIEVLIDERSQEDKNIFLARTYGDAPEVDGNVYVSGPYLKAGEFKKVRITDVLEYDLVGEAI